MMKKSHSLGSYIIPLILIASILLGGVIGCFFSQFTPYLKPIGDIFLNLIFTAIVPLIFFSIASAIARVASVAKLGLIFGNMLLVFIFTGLVAAVFALVVVHLFPPAQSVTVFLQMPEKIPTVNVFNQLVGIFTVTDFIQLFSHEHILALIVFSLLVGVATAASKEKAQSFAVFLEAGEVIFMRVFSLIMYVAPLGFFAYFAVLVSELGPQLIRSYMRIATLYYLSTLIYFLVVFTGYAYLAGKMQGVRIFWSNVFLPFITSIATCSSAASIPANLIATKSMRVAPEIYETVVPLGSIIHKDGSVIGGMFKIAFLFGVFNVTFSGTGVILTALGVSVLVGTVMGAIPSGGMLGEFLILTLYGFPPSALMAIAAISIIIDPMATMVNVTGNSVSSMMIARLVDGKNWLTRKA